MLYSGAQAGNAQDNYSHSQPGFRSTFADKVTFLQPSDEFYRVGNRNRVIQNLLGETIELASLAWGRVCLRWSPPRNVSGGV